MQRRAVSLPIPALAPVTRHDFPSISYLMLVMRRSGQLCTDSDRGLKCNWCDRTKGKLVGFARQCAYSINQDTNLDLLSGASSIVCFRVLHRAKHSVDLYKDTN